MRIFQKITTILSVVVLSLVSNLYVYNKAMSDSGGRVDSVLNGRLQIDHANNRLLVVDENNVPKLLAGVDGDGAIKVKLAQDGVDVLGATDEQLVWSSDFNSFKIVDTFTDTNPALTHTASGSWGSTSRNHNIPNTYGFIPTIMAVANISGGYWPLPLSFFDPAGPIFIKIGVKADADNITVNTTIMTNNVTTTYAAIDIKYYVLRETAN